MKRQSFIIWIALNDLMMMLILLFSVFRSEIVLMCMKFN